MKQLPAVVTCCLLSIVSVSSVHAHIDFSYDGVLPNLYTDTSIAESHIQLMAIDMENADCNELKALDPEVKEAFLRLHMMVRIPGSLTKAIDPNCSYLGEVEQIATIDDTSLTVSDNKEILYYLPAFDTLIVSDAAGDTIAYGMEVDAETEPLDFFLERRDDAQNMQIAAKSAGVISMNTAFGQQSSAQSSVGFFGASIASSETLASSSIAPSNQQSSQSLAAIEPNDDPASEVFDNASTNTSTGFWVFMIVAVLIIVGVCIVILRTRVSKKDGYTDS